MKLEEIKKEFKEEFGIHFKRCKGELEFAEQFIEDVWNSARESMKEEIIKKIEKRKQTTQKETGAFKYDFAYDEIIEFIKSL